jgi:8-oxo-dGTP pyrophosphatase MutT (NUDIX family)
MQNEAQKSHENEPSMEDLLSLCEKLSQLSFVDTSVGVLLTRQSSKGETEYLTVFNADKNSYGNPAGHVRKGKESLLEAAEREITEETGLALDSYQITGIRDIMLISAENSTKLDIVLEGTITAPVSDQTEIENDEDVTHTTFMTAAEIRAQTPAFEEQIGSTVLRMAIDTPKRTPLEMVKTIVDNFDETVVERL